MAREGSASFLDKRKMERLYADYDLNDVIDRPKYNLIMGGIVVYGLVINYILCKNVPNVYLLMNPFIFLLMYIVLVIAGTAISARSDNPIISFIGYNMVVVPCGLVVSLAVQLYGGLESDIVSQAFLIPYKPEYSEAVRLCLLYFRHNDRSQHAVARSL